MIFQLRWCHFSNCRSWLNFKSKLSYVIFGITGIGMLFNHNMMAASCDLPKFSQVNVIDLERDITAQIEHYKTIAQAVSQDSVELTWAKIMQPLEDASASLDRLVNLASHLHMVKDSSEFRAVYPNIIKTLTKFNADFLQNHSLYTKIMQLSHTAGFQLNLAQQKIIKDLLINFKLAGVDLASEQQQRYQLITAELSDLSNKFSQNVLDATQNWNYYIAPEESEMIAGLPSHFLQLAQKDAQKQGKKGWILTLDLPTVEIVLKYAQKRELRKMIYQANITKASELSRNQLDNLTIASAVNQSDKITKSAVLPAKQQANSIKAPELSGDLAAKFDNSKIMQQIVKLRQELAQLLGFKNYSEYSLVHKIAKNPNEVVDFLNELALKSLPAAQKEFKLLQDFALQQDQLTDVQAWDVAYYAELYREKLFNLSTEQLRNYFQLNHVLTGMFNLARDLYGIKIQEEAGFDSWDPAVKLYKVTDQHNNLTGYFYVDLFVRANKQGGAWMGSALSRHRWAEGKLQVPVAFLVTNFMPSDHGDPLLYHSDVVTLLHEFGHVLHHILTKVDYISIAGCNGVEWDAVELPSQFMEKWAYDWDFLQDVAIHYNTRHKLSKEQFKQLLGIKNYNSGMFMVRQLEFGMFDFKLHLSQIGTDVPENMQIQSCLDQVRAMVAVIPVASFNRFQHSFSHIFAGGYAAGYYSYNWAEVLATDAFMAFHDPKHASDPAFKRKLGAKFLANILQQGGSKPAMELYLSFRGKMPDINNLLIDRNLTTST